MKFSLDYLKTMIFKTFSDGIPNGWLLEWDQSRYFSEITTAALPFDCWNYTSFDYSFCNNYVVEIPSDHADKEWSLTVLISFTFPVYSMHWNRFRIK